MKYDYPVLGISGARPPKLRKDNPKYDELLELAMHCRDLLVSVASKVTVIHGGAAGIDTISDIAAREAGHAISTHLPDYARYGSPRALFERNSLIVKDVVDDPRGELHAFPASYSSGTFDTIQKMALEDLSKLWVHYYDPDKKEVVAYRSSEAVSYLKSVGHEIKLHAKLR